MKFIQQITAVSFSCLIIFSGCTTSKPVQNISTIKKPSQEIKKQVIDASIFTKFNKNILIVDDYIIENKYDLAKQTLEKMALDFSDYAELGDKIVKKIADIENTKEKNRFSNYLKMYNDGYYYDTMSNLNVGKGSLNYNEAQELIKKCKKALETKVDKKLLDAENLYNNKKYEEAYLELDDFVGDYVQYSIIKDIKIYNYNKIAVLYNKCKRELAPIYLSIGKKLYNQGSYESARSKLYLAQRFAKLNNLKSLEKEIVKYEKLTIEKEFPSSSAPSISNTSNITPTIGMSSEEVKNSSWGKPKTINKTTTTYGTSEQWVYTGNKYVYLENGVVTAIQESN